MILLFPRSFMVAADGKERERKIGRRRRHFIVQAVNSKS